MRRVTAGGDATIPVAPGNRARAIPGITADGVALPPLLSLIRRDGAEAPRWPPASGVQRNKVATQASKHVLDSRTRAESVRGGRSEGSVPSPS
jgi:hypothetical protein